MRSVMIGRVWKTLGGNEYRRRVTTCDCIPDISKLLDKPRQGSAKVMTLF